MGSWRESARYRAAAAVGGRKGRAELRLMMLVRGCQPGPCALHTAARARLAVSIEQIAIRMAFAHHHHCGARVCAGCQVRAAVSDAFTCAPRCPRGALAGPPQLRSGLASDRQMAAFAPPMMQLTKQPRAARDAPGPRPQPAAWLVAAPDGDAGGQRVTRSAIGTLEIGDSGAGRSGRSYDSPPLVGRARHCAMWARQWLPCGAISDAKRVQQALTLRAAD